jgi:hypothetical protein
MGRYPDLEQEQLVVESKSWNGSVAHFWCHRGVVTVRGSTVGKGLLGEVSVQWRSFKLLSAID